MKGLIALDIDGTLTAGSAPVPHATADYLQKLSDQGWAISVVTGRTFSFGIIPLKGFKFPYHFLVQNGAAIVQMPGKKVIFKNYLYHEILKDLDSLFRYEGCSYLIEGGIERADCCFYRSSDFTQEELDYFAFRQQLSNEKWKDLSSFDAAELESFPLIKCFAKKEPLERIASAIMEKWDFTVSIVTDPFKEEQSILLMTDSYASKGKMVRALQRRMGAGVKIIAAGDDRNDESMLQEADYKIVMDSAPATLKELADFVAPSAALEGIIPALKQATTLIGEK